MSEVDSPTYAARDQATADGVSCLHVQDTHSVHSHSASQKDHDDTKLLHLRSLQAPYDRDRQDNSHNIRKDIERGNGSPEGVNVNAMAARQKTVPVEADWLA